MIKSEQMQALRNENGAQHEPTKDELQGAIGLVQRLRVKKLDEYMSIDHGDIMARVLFDNVQRELRSIDDIIIVLRDEIDELE